MPWEIMKTAEECTIFALPPVYRTTEYRILQLSDTHDDNLKSRIDLRHTLCMDAVRQGAAIVINGDMFDLMQGREDRRSSKSSLRPEHVGNNYFDRVVDWMVEQYAPYKNHLIQVNYGNHETACIQKHEFDPLAAFVRRYNAEVKPDIPVQLGRYRCWIILRAFKPKSTRNRSCSYRIHYFHGSGGGGPVTKSMIAFQREMVNLCDADALCMGHTHYAHIHPEIMHGVHTTGTTYQRSILCLQTPTLKDDWTGGMGWAIERGMRPKPIGGIWHSIEWLPHRTAFRHNATWAQPR